MKKLAIFIVLALLLVLCAAPVYAQPALPHAFYGTVEINNSPAPDGTQISATVDEGVTLTTNKNPVATVNGNYGIDGPHLLVQGDGLSGAITFYVNGVEAEGVTATFEAGGGPTPRDLSVTIVAPPPRVTGVGPVAPRFYVDTTLFGIEASYRISDTGRILETIEATSADGMLTIIIPRGTIALDEDGNPLDSLTADVEPSPPPPPEDAYIIGLAYDFGPDGATFDPPITLTWSYDPDALPEGVAEEDLVIAWYDEEAREWVELPGVVDPVANTITAEVSHFTCFAIITPPIPVPPPAPAAFSVSDLTIRPAEVQPKETVTITVSVANTGGTEGSYTIVLMIKGAKEAEKSVTVAAGDSQLVSFSVSKEAAGTYSVVVDGLSGSFVVIVPVPPAPPPPPPPAPPVKPPVNWPLIGGIIAAVVVVALLIFFLVVRRRAY